MKIINKITALIIR
ncbi:hypothetical protein YPPY58_0916, partial [Yersinia pestis PY-58]